MVASNGTAISAGRYASAPANATSTTELPGRPTIFNVDAAAPVASVTAEVLFCPQSERDVVESGPELAEIRLVVLARVAMDAEQRSSFERPDHVIVDSQQIDKLVQLRGSERKRA